MDMAGVDLPANNAKYLGPFAHIVDSCIFFPIMSLKMNSH